MRLGLDLGGTKIEAIVLTDAGEMRDRRRIATPGNDYDAIVAASAQLVNAVERDVGPVESIGIGTPGSVSLVDGAMKNCNTTCLNGRFLQRDLEKVLRRPVRVANDANCFALSEALDGAAAGHRTVFGVILGTGVGGGVVVCGRLLGGPSGIGSEWGHNLMPGLGTEFEDQHRPCYCGNVNCVETYLSGPGFSESHSRRTGQELAAAEIAANAEQGDEPAVETLATYQRQLAYALSQIVNVLDPDVIVLGGGVSNIASLYAEVPAQWDRWIFSDSVRAWLLPARYGDSSGARGAAWLWSDPGEIAAPPEARR